MQFLLIAVGCLAGVGLIMSMNGPLMVLGVFLLCFIFWRSAQAVGGPSWYVERESVPVDEGLNSGRLNIFGVIAFFTQLLYRVALR